jgi:hypothetical protein
VCDIGREIEVKNTPFESTAATKMSAPRRRMANLPVARTVQDAQA